MLSFEVSVIAGIEADSGADRVITLRPLMQLVALIVVVVSVAIVILGLGRCVRLGLCLVGLGLAVRRGRLRRPMGDGSLRDPAARFAGIEDILIQTESTRVKVEVTLGRGEVADLLVGPRDLNVRSSRDAVYRIAQVVIGGRIKENVAARRRGRWAADISRLATPCSVALGVENG